MENYQDDGHDEDANIEMEKTSEIDELRRTINRGSIESAFSTQSMPSAIRYLVEPGDEVRQLLMRVILPNKQTAGLVRSIAAMHHLAKCQEFGDAQGEDELMNVLASSVSVVGTGRNELVDAIIGEHRKRVEGGFKEKLQKLAGIGEHDNKESRGGT